MDEKTGVPENHTFNEGSGRIRASMAGVDNESRPAPLGLHTTLERDRVLPEDIVHEPKHWYLGTHRVYRSVLLGCNRNRSRAEL